MKRNHYYIAEIWQKKHIVLFMGREKDFNCLVCRKGNNAYCFNMYYDDKGGYQTLSYGKEHLPKIIKDLGIIDEIIVDSTENINKYL